MGRAALLHQSQHCLVTVLCPSPPPSQALTVLGKLGGRNRRFLMHQPPRLEHRDNPEHGFRCGTAVVWTVLRSGSRSTDVSQGGAADTGAVDSFDQMALSPPHPFFPSTGLTSTVHRSHLCRLILTFRPATSFLVPLDKCITLARSGLASATLPLPPQDGEGAQGEGGEGEEPGRGEGSEGGAVIWPVPHCRYRPVTVG